MIHLDLLRLLGERRHAAVLLGALGTVGTLIGVTYVVQAVLLGHVFGHVVGTWSQPGPYGVGELAPWLFGLGGTLLLRPLLVAARELMAVRLMTRVKLALRADLAECLVRSAAVDVRGRSGGDHALVVDGVENLDAYLSKYVPQQLTVAVTCALVGTVLLVTDLPVGLATVIAALLLPLLPRLWDAALARRGSDHWGAYERMHADFLDSMTGMTSLLVAGADEHRQRALERSSAALLARTLGQLRLSLVESGLAAFALSAVPVVALTGSLARDLPPATVFTLILLAAEMVRPLRELSGHWHAGYAGTFSGRQILDVLDRAAPDGRWRPRPQPLTDAGARTIPQRVRRLEARSISVTYPGADRAALSDVDLDLGAGTSALVGMSGSGKSTAAAALAGLLAPAHGSVLLDGRPASPEDLLEAVSLVSQDPVLFDGTVTENIALARTSPAPADAPDVAEAARLAGIGVDDSSIDLETTVGERGRAISGGQRQRVAIARALHQGRSVLILDEATSALDLRSEAAVVRRLTASRPHLVLALVTHRIASLPDDCPVVVLVNGRVLERGTARDLARAGSRFAQLSRVAQVPA